MGLFDAQISHFLIWNTGKIRFDAKGDHLALPGECGKVGMTSTEMGTLGIAIRPKYWLNYRPCHWYVWCQNITIFYLKYRKKEIWCGRWPSHSSWRWDHSVLPSHRNIGQTTRSCPHRPLWCPNISIFDLKCRHNEISCQMWPFRSSSWRLWQAWHDWHGDGSTQYRHQIQILVKQWPSSRYYFYAKDTMHTWKATETLLWWSSRQFGHSCWWRYQQSWHDLYGDG